jgi:glyoxylase-like metal-dependent hydrolase (beta-lactamase superfamily II)
MATAAEPQPASLPLPGGREGATVRLYPLLTGVGVGPPGYFLRERGRLAPLRAIGIGVPKDQFFKVPIVAFLVEHPGVGRFLIDTGLHPSVAVDPKQNLGRLGASVLFRGLKMDASQAVPAQLRAKGIEPAEIKLIVMTHLHLDHTSAMSEFPGATFVFTKREWEAATNDGQMHGYVSRHFDHAFDYRTVDFEDGAFDSFASFGRSFDLFGDGSVRVVYTPGHTHGHQSLVLRLRDRELLVAGDAIYMMRTLRDNHPPFRVEDGHLFRRSLNEIRLYSEQTPGAVIVPGHDWEAWQALDEVYE